MIKFFYIRDRRGFPVACVAYEYHDDTGRCHIGLSAHHPTDKFNREVARSLAVGRAVQNPLIIFAGPALGFVPGKKTITLLRTINEALCHERLPHRVKRAVKLWISDSH